MTATSSAFPRIAGELHVEGVALRKLAADYGTPLYVYSRAALTEAYLAYAQACHGRRAHVHFAVKSNSNIAVLNLLARLGAGFDIVSGGELARVLAAGGAARDTVFSGVGKNAREMSEALEAGVGCFNVESVPELHLLNQVAARLGVRARVALRVNPDVDPKTHPYISTGLKSNKFGIAFEEARATYRSAAQLPCLDVIGIACHIGSQITEISPYLDALDKLFDLIGLIEQDGARLQQIDIGGGLGISYESETPPAIGSFVTTLLDRIAQRGFADRDVFFEPGRSLVGNAGLLLTRVEFLKPGAAKNFAIVDAAMNDLARPAMYQAYHAVETVEQRHGTAAQYDVVGPICESGDWLARDRLLTLAADDLLVLRSAGAYGFVMSSNYNTRPRAAEVLVDGDQAYLIRERETVAQLFAGERLLPQ